MGSLGYAPVAPLVQSYRDGFELTKTFQQNAAQNLKMFILTSPGERIMEPQFGLGINKTLFEVNTQEVREDIKMRIFEGVAEYLPYIRIFSIDMSAASDVNSIFSIFIRISFSTTVVDKPQTLTIAL